MPATPRPLSYAQKYAAIQSLYWSARVLKAAWLRQRHPSWTAEQIEAEVRRQFAVPNE